MSEDKHSRSEQPTAKRLEKATEKGKPQSRDLSFTVTLFAAILSLNSSGAFMTATLRKLWHDIFYNLDPRQVTAEGVYDLMLRLFGTIGAVLTPFLLTVIIAGVAINILQQGGVRFSSAALSFSLEKFDPLQGMKRLFGKTSKAELLKSMAKLLVVAFIAYRVLRDEIDAMLYLAEGDVEGILAFTSHLSFKIILHTCGVLLILSVLDLAFIKWQFIQNIKMTKQEVKDEHKDAEGDQTVKGKIRGMMAQKAMKRMMQVVPTADVVITNPTHYAVALKYEGTQMGAPMVLAKGVDHLALKIKEVARSHNVTIVENRYLARELYAQVAEGQEIPEALYAAVAEVLAYVYRLKGRM